MLPKVRFKLVFWSYGGPDRFCEEREFALKSEVKWFKSHVRSLENSLEESAQSIEEYQRKVEELELQGSRKGLLDERERWKRLVESLREDVANLKAQLLKRRSRSTSSVEYSGRRSGSEDTEIPKSHANGDVRNGKALEDVPNASECGEVAQLRLQLKERDQEIEALRKKLDYELEQKWMRKKKNNGWKQSLIDSFKEVIAPIPSPTLDAISDKSQTLEGLDGEEAAVV